MSTLKKKLNFNHFLASKIREFEIIIIKFTFHSNID
jgi:hypothetical protein